jgi:hypothetical protein
MTSDIPKAVIEQGLVYASDFLCRFASAFAGSGVYRGGSAKVSRGFLHADSETEIYLPFHRPNQRVAPRHLAVVRTMLDAQGLLDGDEFDRLLVAVGSRQSVLG